MLCYCHEKAYEAYIIVQEYLRRSTWLLEGIQEAFILVHSTDAVLGLRYDLLGFTAKVSIFGIVDNL